MHNITLNCTVHEESGRCNFTELFGLIEPIKPDIIFEELSHSNFNDFYNEQTRRSLETDTIKKYVSYYNVQHIPVDTYDLPKHYHEQLDRMYYKVMNSNKIPECRQVQNILDDNMLLMIKGGFDYLNSTLNNDRIKAMNILIDRVLMTLGDQELLRIRMLEKEVIEKREFEMLANIYTYSQKHPFRQALFFIGCGHRESIINKIIEFNATQKNKLNWAIRDNENNVPLAHLIAP